MLAKVKKAEENEKDEQIVWGEVYAPNRPDVHGEFMDAEAIKQMAYDFMRQQKLDQIDTQHDNKTTPGVTVVESFIAREGDPNFIPGAWVIAVHVADPDLWAKVKSGKLNGFSVEALVFKEIEEVEVDIPDVVTGTTTEVQEHQHKFQVSFDDKGDFQGGYTDLVDGHMHKIIGGTVTEISDGHRHRFSAVDNVVITELNGD